MPTAKKPAAKKPAAKSTKKPAAAAKAQKVTASKKKSAASKTAKSAAKPAKKKTVSKRELIEPHKGDKRYVRRKADGTFGKTVDVGKSLSSDSRSKAKKKVAKGQGDRGDTRR